MMIQVHPNGILAFDGDGKLQQSLAVGTESEWIVSSTILDPYIIILFNTGNISLYSASSESNQVLESRGELNGLDVSAVTLYSDKQGLLPLASPLLSGHK